MKVVITGGAGFLGQRLARELLRRGTLRGADGVPQAIERITLVDVAEGALADERLRSVVGDIADPAVLADAVSPDTQAVFHLAAVVSGQAEADFELGMRVNLDATRALLERCRALPSAPRVVFTSSVAVYGPAAQVDDATALRPQSSYGIQKAIGELLLADYSRRGFVDGRCLRLPTICVRPGKPNKAASSFVSGVIREPLSGVDSVCPVDPSVRVWLLSPRRAIKCLIAGFELEAQRLQGNRSINLPGLSVSVAEMLQALERVAGPAARRHVRMERDPAIERIVASWPGAWDARRALALGLQGDESFEAIVRAYIQDELRPA
jgi:nucleoside-diphosphate-sugar epimerase